MIADFHQQTLQVWTRALEALHSVATSAILPRLRDAGILVVVVVMSLPHAGMPAWLGDLVWTTRIICFTFFALELLILYCDMGYFAFTADGWNLFDTLVWLGIQRCDPGALRLIT